MWAKKPQNETQISELLWQKYLRSNFSLSKQHLENRISKYTTCKNITNTQEAIEGKALRSHLQAANYHCQKALNKLREILPPFRTFHQEKPYQGLNKTSLYSIHEAFSGHTAIQTEVNPKLLENGPITIIRNIDFSRKLSPDPPGVQIHSKGIFFSANSID